MAILTGQPITAALLRRLQPARYYASASAALNGAVTLADIPGATVTFTTETAASYVVRGYFDADQLGTNTGLMLGYCSVDGWIVGGQAINSDPVASDRHSIAMLWRGSFSSAGSHTVKLVGTLAANQSFRQDNTQLEVVITEIV
ncbi:hypothetical protein [Micromonospora marina]|uniref:hypothetical protein n=1 Tax=Micromonospora marina TaxID=307120 RepID=UPI003D71C77A